MAAGREARQREGAKQQSLFREVNERIAELNEAWQTNLQELLCECSDRDCLERISVTRTEYESARARSTCFLLKPGHERAELQHVVETTERFLLVETVDGAARVAAVHDPRTRRTQTMKVS